MIKKSGGKFYSTRLKIILNINITTKAVLFSCDSFNIFYLLTHLTVQ
jgi:hypothetical protein